MVEIQNLMEKLAAFGVSVMLQADHDRYEKHGEYWTLLISGTRIPDEIGFVRSEERTVSACVDVALSRLLKLGGEWAWVSEFISHDSDGSVGG